MLRHRVGWTVVALALFGSGWAAGRLGRPGLARASETVGAPTSPAPADSVIDPIALQANANLVGQLGECRRDLGAARTQTTEAERRATEAANALPAQIVTPREEWSRMASGGTVRLRVPCASYDSNGISDLDGRAKVVGLSPEELEALAGAYRKTHERTWRSIRATCEGEATFSARVKSVQERARRRRGAAFELGEAQLVDLCRPLVLEPDETTTRSTWSEVAQLRGAGRGSERARDDRERFAFALTESERVLLDEMVRAVGREKALRAVDHGILCLQETTYETRPPPEPQGEEG